MEERKLNEKESLELIAQMIQNTKNIFPCSVIIRFSILLKCSFRFLFISKGKTEQRYIENSINKLSFQLFIVHLGFIIIQ